MTAMYPIYEPHVSGLLDVGEGQQIYYEVSGNPTGKPVVFVHGGPGGGAPEAMRGFFNPEKYRIVLFDQRGCGRSVPNVADEGVDLAAALAVNTTDRLIADIEKLREHLGIDRWQVFGGSWGSTLSLSYAQAHPDRVTELVLRGIFMLRKTELDWYYNGGAAHLFPDLWEQYLAPIPQALKPAADDILGRTRLPEVDLITVFHELLHDEDREVVVAAAKAWSVWEGATSRILVPEDTGEHDEERFAVAFARIENHYFVNGGFMEEGAILKPENIAKIKDIPAVIVQGRYDVVCPPVTAWQLHKAWPEADFVFSPVAGHASTEEQTLSHLIAATDRFASNS